MPDMKRIADASPPTIEAPCKRSSKRAIRQIETLAVLIPQSVIIPPWPPIISIIVVMPSMGSPFPMRRAISIMSG